MTWTITLVKAVAYRVYSSGITMAITYFVTGHIQATLAIGLAEFIAKVFSYTAFERLWNTLLRLLKRSPRADTELKLVEVASTPADEYAIAQSQGG